MSAVLERLRSVARRAAARLAPGGLVLLYHRVTRLSRDPQRLAISPERFAEHLEFLRARLAPMPLAELVDAARERRLPRGAVAVTFDDGYLDNLVEAAPRLAAARVPATVFVATGPDARGEEFYWDELERIVLGVPLPANELVLECGGETLRWTAPDDRERDPAHVDPAWHVEAMERATPRQRLYAELCRMLQPAAPAERRGALARLRAWAGVAPSRRESHRTLTPAELRALAEGGGLEVGGHTADHPRLASLDATAQAAEIRAGREALESALQRPVESFAYPYGGRTDVDDGAVEQVRVAGFRRACVNVFGVVRAGTSPFELPRLLVRDWGVDELARRLLPYAAR